MSEKITLKNPIQFTRILEASTNNTHTHTVRTFYFLLIFAVPVDLLNLGGEGWQPITCHLGSSSIR